MPMFRSKTEAALYCGGAVCAYGAYWMYTFRPRKNFPPGPAPYPFLGTLFKEEHQEEELVEMGKEYGPVFSASKFGTKPCVFVNDYEIYKNDVKSMSKVFVDRPVFPINDLIDGEKGIVFSNGAHWVATRAFGQMAMRERGMGSNEMYDMLWAEVKVLRGYLSKKVAVNNQFDPNESIQSAVINVITSLVFGQRFDQGDPALQITMDALGNDTTFLYDTLGIRLTMDYSIIFTYLPKWLLSRTPVMAPFYKWRDLIQELVDKTDKEWDRKNPSSVLEHFVAEREKNPDGIMAQKNVLEGCILDLFGAGSDTTQNTVRWALKYLALYPELQEELYAEGVAVIGKGAQPKAGDIYKMPKFDAFLHEVMRYVSLIPQGLQHLPTEDVKIGGFDIPKGTDVYLNLLAVHRDPRYWKYPDTFNIENFLGENGKCSVPAQFVPFGWGKRICLGSALARAEYFVFVYGIMQDYKLSFPEKYTMAAKGDVLRRPADQDLVFTAR